MEKFFKTKENDKMYFDFLSNFHDKKSSSPSCQKVVSLKNHLKKIKINTKNQNDNSSTLSHNEESDSPYLFCPFKNSKPSFDQRLRSENIQDFPSDYSYNKNKYEGSPFSFSRKVNKHVEKQHIQYSSSLNESNVMFIFIDFYKYMLELIT